MRVAIVNSFGFESGGMTTLCIEYSKLGFDVYVRNVTRPLKYKTILGNIFTYTSENDLISISLKYDRLIFLPPAYKSEFKSGKYMQSFLPIIKLRETNPNLQLCYLYCSRDAVDFSQYLIPTLHKLNFDFDYYYSISTEVSELVPNVICFDINAFQFNELPVIAERENIILTAGRVEGFKGIIKYFKKIGVDNHEFKYVHEGAGFSFNKTGTISVPLQLMDMKMNPKFKFKSYNDPSEYSVINIYPTYDLTNSQVRWSHYFAGICCIMGTEHRYIRTGLFDNCWRVDDAKEQSAVNKQSKLWKIRGLEYANLEMIDCGLPVLLSRGYSELLGFTDSNLIYSCFDDIPNMLKKLKDPKYYKVCTDNQRIFFSTKQNQINKQIFEIFTGD